MFLAQVLARPEAVAEGEGKAAKAVVSEEALAKYSSSVLKALYSSEISKQIEMDRCSGRWRWPREGGGARGEKGMGGQRKREGGRQTEAEGERETRERQRLTGMEIPSLGSPNNQKQTYRRQRPRQTTEVEIGDA